VSTLPVATTAAGPVPAGEVRGGRSGWSGRRPSPAWLGVVPFLAYVGVFLLLPTTIVDAFNRVASSHSPLATSLITTAYVTGTVTFSSPAIALR